MQTSEENGRYARKSVIRNIFLPIPIVLGSSCILTWGTKEERTPNGSGCLYELTVDMLPLKGEKTPKWRSGKRLCKSVDWRESSK